MIDNAVTGSAYCNLYSVFYKIHAGKLKPCLSIVNYLWDKDFELKSEITSKYTILDNKIRVEYDYIIDHYRINPDTTPIQQKFIKQDKGIIQFDFTWNIDSLKYLPDKDYKSIVYPLIYERNY